MHTIAIVGGTGPAGSGLASRWARAGQRVIIGSRDAARAQQKAAEIAAQTGNQNVSGAANAEAGSAAEIIVLTVPFTAQAQTLKDLKLAFRPGIILIDATVALASTVGGRATRVLGVWQGSAAQQAAELVSKGVLVAAAFQNIGAELLQSAADVDCDVIVCSDHDEARQAAIELANLIPGARGIDGGRLENARTVEQLTALLIAINTRYKVHSAGLRITGLPTMSSLGSKT